MTGLRVVRGHPTAEELAALVAVLHRLADADPTAAPAPAQLPARSAPWRRPDRRQPGSPAEPAA